MCSRLYRYIVYAYKNNRVDHFRTITITKILYYYLIPIAGSDIKFFAYPVRIRIQTVVRVRQFDKAIIVDKENNPRFKRRQFRYLYAYVCIYYTHIYVCLYTL